MNTLKSREVARRTLSRLSWNIVWRLLAQQTRVDIPEVLPNWGQSPAILNPRHYPWSISVLMCDLQLPPELTSTAEQRYKCISLISVIILANENSGREMVYLKRSLKWYSSMFWPEICIINFLIYREVIVPILY